MLQNDYTGYKAEMRQSPRNGFLAAEDYFLVWIKFSPSQDFFNVCLKLIVLMFAVSEYFHATP